MEIEIQTLIDITNTRVVRPNQGSQIEHSQYKNFTTLKQCAEIRSNISFAYEPQCELRDISGMEFGTEYQGVHAVWTFRFSPDRSGVYSTEKSSVGCLIDDLDQVPVIKNLRETVNIEKATFELKDPLYKNTVVREIKGLI
jgi:hypothetical protein